MAAHESSTRRRASRACAALAGALTVSACAGTTTSGPPEGTPTSTEEPAAGYTVEQVRSAVASVDSEASALELRVHGPEAIGISDPTTEPADCAEPLQNKHDSMQRHVPEKVVSGVGDEGRVRVRAAVFADAQTAQSAGAIQAPAGEGPCLEYTVTSGESGVTTRVSDTAFAVNLPGEASQVRAVSRESVSFDEAFQEESRDSQVHAVVENVWVTVSYGAARERWEDAEPEAIPLQAERAAAERAARQVLAELTGTRLPSRSVHR